MSNPAVMNLPTASASHTAASRPAGAPSHSAFVPLLLSTLTLLVFFTYQVVDAYGQRQTLLAAHASQQQTVDSAGKLRGSLDALAADTQRLADAGNPNAGALVTELRKRGITINTTAVPNATPAGASAPR
ncbi:MAG: hypothetical protein Q8K96_16460 [Rubrivivax sp.]|nr:hypothetical protein [Rubrivivax sp.]